MNWLSNPFDGILRALDLVNDFSADLFWNVATSPFVLAVVGLVAIAAFLIAHVPFVERIMPAAAAYTRSALIVQVLASALLMFLLGFAFADQRADAERLKNELAWSQFQLEQQRATTEEAERLKAEADARAAVAKGRLDEYEEKFGNRAPPAAGAACTPAPGYLEWLHHLQRHRAGVAAARQRGGAVARLRATGAKRR